ncbi:MAG: hypothetical protein ACYC4E_00770 [Carboxydocellales bacterium]
MELRVPLWDRHPTGHKIPRRGNYPTGGKAQTWVIHPLDEQAFLSYNPLTEYMFC